MIQSYFVETLTIAAAISLTYFNHTRTRTSSSVLLIFWPLYTIGLTVWLRTVVAKDLEHYPVVLALKSAVLGLGLVTFGLECVGPEVGLPPDAEKVHQENPVITANVFSRWVCASPLLL